MSDNNRLKIQKKNVIPKENREDEEVQGEEEEIQGEDKTETKHINVNARYVMFKIQIQKDVGGKF